MMFMVQTADVLAEETIFGGEDASYDFFGGPALKRSSIAGDAAWLVGGQMGMSMNHSFNVGFGAYGLATDVAAPSQANAFYPGRSLEVELAYGGMEIGYVYKPEKVLHATVGLLLGAGNCGFRDESSADPDEDFDRIDTFFILEPTLTMTANVTAWFHAGCGVSYRLISDLNVAGIESGDVDGLSLVMTLNFGSF